MNTTPVCPVRLKKGKEDAVRAGMPWIYAGDLIESSEILLVPAGSIVTIESHKGQFIGIGYVNPHSQITCRVLSLSREPINVHFFRQRLEQALAFREKRVNVPYYRLVHSEPDGFPGVLIDRFGQRYVVQVGTAGMELLQPLWLQAMEELLAPEAVILRNDFASRRLEGLNQHVTTLKGHIPELIEVLENGCTYLADLKHGQKTGWFYDQRDNRRMMASYANGKRVADIYSHSGGFGLLATKAGARSVTLVDSSGLALDLAKKAAALNGVSDRLSCLQGSAFECMEHLAEQGQRFDIVLADPPAFVKSKKDMHAGLKGYEKVARLAAALAVRNGLLFVASCSHHAQRQRFTQAVKEGVAKAGYEPEVLAQTGAAADHPRHPLLPQNEYLKGILLKLT